ncbi:MAG: patatin [Gammaproteobacteria bacterium]|nr:MAG: patatin [Gammaproteobacteria bacterium]
MTEQVTLKPKIGLALGSGSARGLAHIGVIRALKDAGIHVDCVAGTSIGAAIGAVYASGKLDSLQETYLAMDWKKIAYFFDVVFPKSGIIDGKKVIDFMREYVHSECIEELPLPFKAVATELNSGEEVVLETGDVMDAVRASISVPGMFTPVRRNGRVLVDGGLVNPVPVNVARAMGADIVIAVDINHGIVEGKAPAPKAKSLPDTDFLQSLSLLENEPYRSAMERIEKGLRSLESNPTLIQIRAWLAEESLPNIFEVLLSSINIMETQITSTRLQIDPPELLIQPPLGSVRFLEFNRAEEVISIGYETTRQQLERLPPDFFTRMRSHVNN